MESLFNKVGCDSSAITDMLGGQGGVSETNILQYMGIIEQKANELLQLHSYSKAKETGDTATMAAFLATRAPKVTAGSLSIQPPSTV